jgi:dTDP-4-dehydrorhamnose reductase
MKLFTDEFRCPIPAVATARAVWELARKNCTGLYHAAGAEKLSRWQIGELLVKRWPEVTAKIEAGSAQDFPGPRARWTRRWTSPGRSRSCPRRCPV